jgi:hypothetical protein
MNLIDKPKVISKDEFEANMEFYGSQTVYPLHKSVLICDDETPFFSIQSLANSIKGIYSKSSLFFLVYKTNPNKDFDEEAEYSFFVGNSSAPASSMLNVKVSCRDSEVEKYKKSLKNLIDNALILTNEKEVVVLSSCFSKKELLEFVEPIVNKAKYIDIKKVFANTTVTEPTSNKIKMIIVAILILIGTLEITPMLEEEYVAPIENSIMKRFKKEVAENRKIIELIDKSKIQNIELVKQISKLNDRKIYKEQ